MHALQRGVLVLLGLSRTRPQSWQIFLSMLRVYTINVHSQTTPFCDRTTAYPARARRPTADSFTLIPVTLIQLLSVVGLVLLVGRSVLVLLGGVAHNLPGK